QSKSSVGARSIFLTQMRQAPWRETRNNYHNNTFGSIKYMDDRLLVPRGDLHCSVGPRKAYHPRTSSVAPEVFILSWRSTSMKGIRWPTAFFITRADLITWGRNIFPAPNSFYEFYSVSIMFLHPRCYGEDVGVKNDVITVKPNLLHEDVVGSRADLNLPSRFCRLLWAKNQKSARTDCHVLTDMAVKFIKLRFTRFQSIICLCNSCSTECVGFNKICTRLHLTSDVDGLTARDQMKRIGLSSVHCACVTLADVTHISRISLSQMIARRRRNNSESDDQPNPYNRYQGPSGQTFVTQSSPAQSYSQEPLLSVYDGEMSCRDRTNEFKSAVKSQQTRQVNGVVSRKSAAIKHRSEFTQIAKRIGKDLANTFAKLEKLALLAKRKSLFDDKPLEIQELTYIIKEDMNSLNKQIAQLQQLARGQTTGAGLRTENLKHQKNRREEYSQSSVMTTTSQNGFGSPGQSVLLQDEVKHSAGAEGGDFMINMDDNERSRYQQQLQLIDEQNIESTIVELGSIFTQLAHMVKEQEESVQRIDSNVEDAHLNIEAAHGELLKYFQSVTNNRWLMIKIFAVLIIFFIIFIVFMA
ncbi:STX5-like protein, partial [Mya arenaria]